LDGKNYGECELHERLLPDSDLSSKLVVVLPIEFDQQPLVLLPGLPLVGFSLGKSLGALPEAPLELTQLRDPLKLPLACEFPAFEETLQPLAFTIFMDAFVSPTLLLLR
jgi:hypothetical protein